MSQFSTSRFRAISLVLVVVAFVCFSQLQVIQTVEPLQASIFDTMHDWMFGKSSSFLSSKATTKSIPKKISSASIIPIPPPESSAILPVVAYSSSSAVWVSVEGYRFMRTLRNGTAGDDVLNLQFILNRNPLTQMAKSGAQSPGQETGIYDYKTRIGMIAFQKLYLTSDTQKSRLRREQGTAGLTTRAVLEKLAKEMVAKGTLPSGTTNLHAAARSAASALWLARSSVDTQSSATHTTTSSIDDASNKQSSAYSAPQNVSSSGKSSAASSTAISSVTSVVASHSSIASMGPVLPGQTCTLVTQYGITWTFDKAYPCGTFANGDWWVVGPVTITRMTPDFDGQHNGAEVNPKEFTKQGYDVRVSGFTAGFVPTLPYIAQPNQSIVKAISLAPFTDEGCRPCLDTAAVLTVLGSIPEGNGANFFRPPYFSATKTLYKVSDLQLNKLPSYPLVPNAPTLQWVVDGFKRVQLDHLADWVGREMHPVQNMPDYGADIALRTANGALRLMLSDSPQAKLPAVIQYVQGGIDMYQIGASGGTWRSSGGHDQGRKLPIVFAAALLDNAAMKQYIATVPVTNFQDDEQFTESPKANNGKGVVLFGQFGQEKTYWQNLISDTGSRTEKDPYGYIDGGHEPGGSYQGCCISLAAKSTTTALGLMPELRAIWKNDDYIKYSERWVTVGAWTQPDPCAPHDGNMAHYGITFGPDGHGGCILDTNPADGIGRFPTLHGASKNAGGYSSPFANNLWKAYYQLLFTSEGEETAAQTPSVHEAAPTTSNPTIPGLVGRWEFEGNGNDYTGWNNGSLLGNPTFTAGKIGQAIQLNGTTQALEVQSNNALNVASNLTLSVWVNASALSTSQGILTKGCVQSSASNTQYELTYYNSVFRMRISDGTTISTVNSSTTPQINTWYLVTARFIPGQSVDMFVNGVKETSSATSLTSLVATSRLLGVGKDGGCNRLYWSGLLDDARVYNVSLSDAEIAQLYQSTLALHDEQSIFTSFWRSLTANLLFWKK